MNRVIPQEVIEQILPLYKLYGSERRVSMLLGIGRTAVRNHLNPKRKGDYHERAKAKRRVRGVTTTINGVHAHYKANKRPRPDNCELCNKEVVHFDWHHWDDSDLSKGMWLCFRCHQFAEGIEHGAHEEDYLKLKEKYSVKNREY